MPEIGGNLVGYFSPYDPAQLMGLIQTYSDPAKLAKKEMAIKKAYKPTSWADMYGVISRFVGGL
jgi:hypothetical protein